MAREIGSSMQTTFLEPYSIPYALQGLPTLAGADMIYSQPHVNSGICLTCCWLNVCSCTCSTELSQRLERTHRKISETLRIILSLALCPTNSRHLEISNLHLFNSGRLYSLETAFGQKFGSVVELILLNWLSFPQGS